MITDLELRLVRGAIYTAIVERGILPSAREVARVCAIPEPRVDGAFRVLADSQVIILWPGSLDLWAAPPFSAVANAFHVHADGRPWFATCAWDAFGIPAALHADAQIEASCASSDLPIRCGVRQGRAFGTAVIHLLVPAAHFW